MEMSICNLVTLMLVSAEVCLPLQLQQEVRIKELEPLPSESLTEENASSQGKFRLR